ncbi:hypothetical protein TNCV_4462451 [Trichonephila clavipes]|nr:hypothetical protein TNCV_4462451 [Trichonephila clavipes]
MEKELEASRRLSSEAVVQYHSTDSSITLPSHLSYSGSVQGNSQKNLTQVRNRYHTTVPTIPTNDREKRSGLSVVLWSRSRTCGQHAMSSSPSATEGLQCRGADEG